MGELTAEILRGWLRPSEALGKLPADWDEKTKRHAIFQRLATGSITAAAATGHYRRDQAIIREERVCVIPAHIWSAGWYTRDHALWDVGDVSFDDDHPSPGIIVVGPGSLDAPEPIVQRIQFTGVRFEPEGFMQAFDLPAPEYFPSPEPSAPQSLWIQKPGVRKGGAPRKGWWDDLWIEVIGRIDSGELHAGTRPSAAQLEIYLIELAEGMGFSPGDSTLKPMAGKLFKYLQKHGEK
jgi:hypothetical protein